jgi:aspartate aminotransferase
MISGSFSKSHAMTGWRIGYALGDAAWIQSMLKIQSHSTSNASSISQKAALEAATGESYSLRFMLNEYQKRRDYLVPALNAIDGIECAMPEGAFYVFPNIRGTLGSRVKTSGEFSRLLLEEAHVVVTDGAAFGAEGYIRISYANSLENIQKGVEQIAAAVQRSR